MSDEDTDLTEVPVLGARRLLLYGTGSLGVAFLPSWVSWLRSSYTDIELRIVLTHSAERFVTRQSVAALAGQNVQLDVWTDEPAPASPHVDLATWPDMIAVYPASFNLLGRFATGLADTPMTLALQCTAAVIGVAPAVPPGAVNSIGYRQHRAALAQRPNVTVADPVPGLSVHTGRRDAWVAALLPVLLRQMESLRRQLAGEAAVPLQGAPR